MGVAGYVTPVRTETFQRLQLNAGAFLINFDYSPYQSASALRAALVKEFESGKNVLGATRGGGSFTVTSTIREPDMDGKRYRFKNGAFVDDTDAQLAGTLVEIVPERLAQIMATGETTVDGNVKTVKMHTAIQSSDYIDSLVWIGDMSDGGLVLIALKNALNNNGLSLTFADKGEGTIPFEFHAYQSSVEDYDYAPFEIKFFSDAVETTLKKISLGEAVVLPNFSPDVHRYTVTLAIRNTDVDYVKYPLTAEPTDVRCKLSARLEKDGSVAMLYPTLPEEVIFNKTTPSNFVIVCTYPETGANSEYIFEPVFM